MTKTQQRALLKRLEQIHVPVTAVDPESVTIYGRDFAKVVALAHGSRYFTSPVGTDQLRLQ